MTVLIEVTNNATGSLDAGINAVVTTLDVKAGEGALFPDTTGDAAYFYVTLQKDSGAWEIVKVTERTADQFTIVRNQDSSTGAAQAFSADDIVSLRPCANVITDIVAELNSHSSDHDDRFFTETELTADNSLSIDMGNVNANRSDLLHSDLTDDEAAKHRLIDDDGVSATVLWSAQQLLDINVGMVRRPTFVWSDVDTITLNGFRYHHAGTLEQIVKNDTTLTFDFVGLTTSAWHFLYIDDSAVVSAGTNVISATELLNSIDTPVWDADQLGYYGSAATNTQATDRCIAAFYSNSSNQLDQFFHSGRRIMWDNPVTIFTSLSAGYVAKTFRAPSFCTEVEALIQHVNDEVSSYYQHPDGSGEQLLLTTRYDNSGDNQDYGTGHLHRSFLLNSSQQGNFKGANASCFQDAYILPQGM
jgi:hypothetical protein